MRFHVLSFAIPALLLSCAAHAAAIPAQSADDYRIKSVDYNPENTTIVDVVVGLALHITVAPGEKYVTHVFGDPKAWAFAHVANNYFIKPTSDKLADTNLVIITNKHTYNILLREISHYAEREADGTVIKHVYNNPWSSDKATVQLTYRYPKRTKAQSKARKVEQEIQASLRAWKYGGPVNWAYWMSSGKLAKGIRPINIWDNYRFTYFRFQPNATLPTIFEVGPDGKETIANVSIYGANHNVIVAHGVARQWRIRYGHQVIGVLNDGYDPSKGANPSGTTSPHVDRVLRHDVMHGGHQ